MLRLPLVPVLLGVFASGAPAQEPARDPHAVQPERPTVATHAYTVAPGWLEIEAGVEFDRLANGTRSGSAPVVVKVGLAPRVQFDFVGAVQRPAGGHTLGVGDLAVALKWRLTAQAPVVGDFAVIPSLKLPTAPTSSGLGSGTTDLGLVLVSSHQLGPVGLDVNLGYTRRSGPDSLAPRSSTVWTASFGGTVVGAMGWTAELYGFPATSGPAGAASIVALLGGPTLLVKPWLALDAGVIVPLTGPQPRALFMGCVYNAGRLWSAQAGSRTISLPKSSGRLN
ncbi:MAG: hypothetical protein ABSG61_00790 [Gemmatimonadales bacterium]|jgi:hypothetical protein